MIPPKLNLNLWPKRQVDGFTLIEIMVSVSIFVVVAMIATGAFITANRINQRAQAVQRIMDNLNFALDDISFKIQKGTDFSCGTSLGTTRCNSPVEAITFKYPKYGAEALRTITLSRQITDGRGEVVLEREGLEPVAITSPLVDITSLRFYIGQEIDEGPGSLLPIQMVQIVISGKAQVGRDVFAFALQTAATERP